MYDSLVIFSQTLNLGEPHFQNNSFKAPRISCHEEDGFSDLNLHSWEKTICVANRLHPRVKKWIRILRGLQPVGNRYRYDVCPGPPRKKWKRSSQFVFSIKKDPVVPWLFCSLTTTATIEHTKRQDLKVVVLAQSTFRLYMTYASRSQLKTQWTSHLQGWRYCGLNVELMWTLDFWRLVGEWHV